MLFMITMFEFRLLKKSPVGRLFPASQHVLGRRWFITIQDSPIAPHESVMLTWFAIHNLPGKTSRLLGKCSEVLINRREVWT